MSLVLGHSNPVHDITRDSKQAELLHRATIFLSLACNLLARKNCDKFIQALVHDNRNGDVLEACFEFLDYTIPYHKTSQFAAAFISRVFVKQPTANPLDLVTLCDMLSPLATYLFSHINRLTLLWRSLESALLLNQFNYCVSYSIIVLLPTLYHIGNLRTGHFDGIINEILPNTVRMLSFCQWALASKRAEAFFDRPHVPGQFHHHSVNFVLSRLLREGEERSWR